MKPVPKAAETRETSIGPITICSDGAAITHLHFGLLSQPDLTGLTGDDLTREAFLQLEEYLNGRRTAFTLPLRPAGTAFQQRVWKTLEEIPYGSTRTYAQIAAQSGNPKACRAVGMANHQNPIAIFIPCHRVIGAGGALTGYAGGLDLKKKLLELEKRT